MSLADRLNPDDLISEQAVYAVNLKESVEQYFEFEAAMEKFEHEVYETGMRVYLQRTSQMTRQRRRVEVRAILMRINEWPKNREPREKRRKSVLGSVSYFMKANPVQYIQGL